MRTVRSLILILIFFVVAGFSSESAFAVEYFVDASKGNDSNPGSISNPWKTISKANSALRAGDTVFFRAGTYTETIAPSASGASNGNITYKRYPQDPEGSVILKTKGYGFHLNNKSFIRISGLNFSGSGSHFGLFQNNSQYNVIENCRFHNSGSYQGIRIEDGSNYNRIENNVFPDAPLAPGFVYWDTECQNQWDKQGDMPTKCNRQTGPADTIRINSGGNLVTGNSFGKVTHSSIADFSKSLIGNVYRNNVFSNGYHRNFETIYDGKVLLEYNEIKDNGKDKKKKPSAGTKNGAGIKINSSYSIIRNNMVKNNNIGLLFGGYQNGISNSSKIYNNTFYNNILQVYQTGNSTTDYNGNSFKNNIVVNDQNQIGRWSDLYGFGTRDAIFTFWFNVADLDQGKNVRNFFSNNVFFPNGKSFYFKSTSSLVKSLPQLLSLYPAEWSSDNVSVDPLLSDEGKMTSASSQQIKAAAWISRITSSTQSSVSSFTVEDASYFYDGWLIPGETGDIIKTESGRQTTIQRINYNTNLITVSPSINIVKGEGIHLNYNGVAPTLGATDPQHESIKPVTGLRVILPGS